MKNLTKPAILLAATLALTGCKNKPANQAQESTPTRPVAAEQIPSQDDMLSGIRSVTAKLEAKTFATLVPDSIIRKSIQEFLDHYRQDTWAANTIARHNVFESELCAPFGSKCWDALYAAYSGGEWYFKNDGIPVEADEPLNQARKIILDKARDYLKDPQKLLTFYQSIKGVIVEELRKAAQTDEEKAQLELWLKGVEEGLKAFDDPKFQKAYATYLAAEKTLHETPYEDPTGQQKYKAYRKAEEALAALTPDLYASLFAGRRAKENPDVVDTYETIVSDLRSSVSGL
ncbi:hypothetical protein HYW82_02190 [Candidatus Peregrinibacteria bacterium]|nr:hypothetical protein [Candidatus Peregrinibacteria bacterium]